MIIRVLGACILASLSISPSSSAESGPLGFGNARLKSPLESDRPDFTESTTTIEPGHLQIEGGYTYTHDDDSENHAIPELLVRAGVTPRSEFRLSPPSYARVDEQSQGSVEGVTDTSIGMKTRLWDGNVPLSLLSSLSLPTGSSGLRANGVEPEVKLCWASALAERIELAGNVGLGLPRAPDRFTEATASLTLSSAITADIGAYVEYFALLPLAAREAEDTHYINGGITTSLSDDLQLDARIGGGLNPDADDAFAGVGFAFRR